MPDMDREALVERIARAIANNERGWVAWDDSSPDRKNRKREQARFVLDAVPELAGDGEWATAYLPLDCPRCGRHRLEYGFRAGAIRVRCEKCKASSDDDTLAAQ